MFKCSYNNVYNPPDLRFSAAITFSSVATIIFFAAETVSKLANLILPT